MDTRQFMEEFVNRQIESSPEKAFLDPQTELITQMTRESDLEDRVSQVSQKPEEEDIPEEEPPQQFTETEAEQTPDAEAADIGTQEGDDAEPAAPPEEEGPLAEPSPPVDSASEVAVPAVPAASEIPLSARPLTILHPTKSPGTDVRMPGLFVFARRLCEVGQDMVRSSLTNSSIIRWRDTSKHGRKKCA